MIRSLSSALALVALSSLAGCAFSSHATPAAGAPHYAATERVDVVPAAPPGGVLLGHVEAQGNNYQSSDGCRERLVKEARELGASSLVVTDAKEGAFIGKGPHCEGDAYRVAGP